MEGTFSSPDEYQPQQGQQERRGILLDEELDNALAAAACETPGFGATQQEQGVDENLQRQEGNNDSYLNEIVFTENLATGEDSFCWFL